MNLLQMTGQLCDRACVGVLVSAVAEGWPSACRLHQFNAQASVFQIQPSYIAVQVRLQCILIRLRVGHRSCRYFFSCEVFVTTQRPTATATAKATAATMRHQRPAPRVFAAI